MFLDAHDMVEIHQIVEVEHREGTVNYGEGGDIDKFPDGMLGEVRHDYIAGVLGCSSYDLGGRE